VSAPLAVSKYSSFEESVNRIEAALQEDLGAPKGRFLPAFQKAVVLEEWDQLEALLDRVTSTPPTDPAFESLGKLSKGETYFVLKHETYWAYFVHDEGHSNNLVGLLVRRRDDYDGVSAELDRLLTMVRGTESSW
jgi:hypothetical protein